MPTIKDSRESGQQRIEAGELIPLAAPTVPPGVPSPVNSYPVNPNPLLRGPLPVQQWQAPDQQRQYQNPAVPQVRISPLPATANAQIGASAQSNALAISQAPAVTVPPTIQINKQSGTSYTLQLSDLDKLVTFSNNSGGTIILPSPSVGATGGTFVQSTGSGSATNTTSVTMTHGAGDTVIVVVKSGSGILTVPTISDSQGHTWVLIDGSFDSGGIPTRMWYATNMSAGSNTISATLIGASFMIMDVVEYSGMPLTASLDQHSSNVTNGSASVVSPPITTGVANALVVGSFINGGGTGVTFTAGTGYTDRFNFTDQFFEDKFVATSGTTLTATATAVPNVSTTVAIIASFRTLTVAAGVQFPIYWFCYLENTGSGTFSVQSAAQIDNVNTPVLLTPNTGMLVIFDGFNWFTMRGIGGGGSGGSGVTSVNTLTGAVSIVGTGGISVVTTSTITISGSAFAAAALLINGVGVSSDKQIFIDGVADGSTLWAIKINGVADGG